MQRFRAIEPVLGTRELPRRRCEFDSLIGTRMNSVSELNNKIQRCSMAVVVLSNGRAYKKFLDALEEVNQDVRVAHVVPNAELLRVQRVRKLII